MNQEIAFSILAVVTIAAMAFAHWHDVKRQKEERARRPHRIRLMKDFNAKTKKRSIQN